MGHVVFVSTSFAGHLNPVLRIARDLGEEGHRVTFVGSPVCREAVCAQGFAFDATPFIGPPGAPLARRRREIAAAIDARVQEIVEGVAELSARLRPDLLVFDPFLLWLYPAFHAHGLPAVVVSVNPLLTPDPRVPPYTSWLVPSASAWRRLAVRLAWAAARLEYGFFQVGAVARELLTGWSPFRLARVLARETGFPLESELRTRPWRFDFALKSVPELVLIPAELDFPRARQLPAEACYVGPCVDLRRESGPFDWEQVPVGRAIVYCSLGTVRASEPAAVRFLRRVADAVAAEPGWVLVLATGDREVTRALGGLPPNVIAREWVPQLEVLARADAMVTHGGMNSVQECVRMGVPMLVYPRRSDQPGNSARVVFHGLGLRGGLARDGSGEIRRKLRQLLHEPSFREHVARMRAHFLRRERERSTTAWARRYLGGEPGTGGGGDPATTAAAVPAGEPGTPA